MAAIQRDAVDRTLNDWRTEAVSLSWLWPDHPNWMVESVKKAEDGADLILRLYENAVAASEGCLHIGLPCVGAAETSLMEEDISPLAVEEQAVRLSF